MTNEIPVGLSDYQSYRNLPALAGLGTMTDAMRIGLSVEECVRRLKRHHWTWRRLHQIFIARLTAEPIYELKMGFSLHAHYAAEHAAAWRRRVGEMREPPLGLDVVPDPFLDAFFDEIGSAPDTASLLVGLYEHAVPALHAALERHMADTNCLFDQPSRRICRFALLEVADMQAYGAQAVSALVESKRREELAGWERLLRDLLANAGGLDGTEETPANRPGVPERQFSSGERTYERAPRRDERFTDPYNMGVHAEAFLYDPAMPAAPKTLMMYYKRLREIDVPEMMASIIAETPQQSWLYVVDMTRQLWDEARHAMMGEVGFIRAGIDWRRFVRVNFTWSLALNTQLTPLERHAVLYFIEQGLMPSNGKRFEWEVGCESGDPFSAMVQDYDWADEVLHARIGREWYVKQMGGRQQAIDYGDQCWSKVLIDWKRYQDEGVTQHENWWPGLYREWCRLRRIEPDPHVLAFHTSYETARADLRELSGSG
jgi:hypothetical protein